LEAAFLGSPKKATTYHPPELVYLEQELLSLVTRSTQAAVTSWFLSGDA
jgi:hypothetical protein